ncbi:MAG: hypothetical protein CR986_03875 [Ignavibacteriae bacterium]|nr:MAG: hypothetical protein CR986_03875 [Ignavibacteriota bacterium]
MKKFKFIFFTIFLIIFSTRTHSQDFDFHFGVNILSPFNILTFSPVGLRIGGDLVFDDFRLRTNFSANLFAGFENNIEYTDFHDCFFTQIEESFIYPTKNKFAGFYFGGGIGYYSITVNEQSDHAYVMPPNALVDNEGFNSNIGLNLILGKEFRYFFLEIKYIYSNFGLERSFHKIIGGSNVKRELDFSFHTLNFSLVF